MPGIPQSRARTQVLNAMICKICEEILYDPIMSSCCSGLYCQSCIDSIPAGPFSCKRCLVVNSNPVWGLVPIEVKDMLREIRVTYFFAEFGCNQLLPCVMESIVDHEADCSALPLALTGYTSPTAICEMFSEMEASEQGANPLPETVCVKEEPILYSKKELVHNCFPHIHLPSSELENLKISVSHIQKFILALGTKQVNAQICLPAIKHESWIFSQPIIQIVNWLLIDTKGTSTTRESVTECLQSAGCPTELAIRIGTSTSALFAKQYFANVNHTFFRNLRCRKIGKSTILIWPGDNPEILNFGYGMCLQCYEKDIDMCLNCLVHL